jgi:hypothetical protein
MQISGDRRAKRRYVLDIGLTYRVLRNGLVKSTGAGRTLNLSSSGIAFVTSETFRRNTFIELSLSWPVLLNDNCPLQLVAEGIVVRSGATMTALSVKRYEFRTQGRSGSKIR